MGLLLTELEAVVREQGERIATLEKRLVALEKIARPKGVAIKRASTTLKHRHEACAALSIGRDTFWRLWHSVFTDPRSPEDRRPRIERRVFADELAIAVQYGGGTRARHAVEAFRRKLGRK